MPALEQQTILITGATDGLGRAVAGELAAAGATVLLHARDQGRGEETIAAIRDESANDDLHLLLADFASLEQVRRLAQQVSGEHDRLDVIVNNAGIGTTLPATVAGWRARTGMSCASPSTTSPATC
jgi:NAD(P)-dependent dehydrogenase (short-subunit alcohol dehydrogenase family)